MKLYNLFRSGTSHRLRIALNLKGLVVEYGGVDLRTEQHLGAAYRALNPPGLVPALQLDGAAEYRLMIQSPAIIEWLEERLSHAGPVASSLRGSGPRAGAGGDCRVRYPSGEQPTNPRRAAARLRRRRCLGQSLVRQVD